MHRPMLGLVLAIGLLAGGPLAAQAPQRPYKEGPVLSVSTIRTLPGQFDNYISYIYGDYAKLMNAEKQAGLILDWGVLSTDTRNPQEPNVILTTTYANMAALDGMDDKEAALEQKLLGRDIAASNTASVQRGPMRTLIGTQLYRVLLPRQ